MTNEYESIAEAVAGHSLVSRFMQTVEARPDAVALRWPSGSQSMSWTWREYAQHAARFAGGLRDLGIPEQSPVIIKLGNRSERYAAEMGLLLRRGIAVPGDDRLGYLADKAGARVLVVDDRSACEQFLREASELTHPCRVVMVAGPDEPIPAGAISYHELMKAAPVDLAQAVASVRPQDECTFLFTSGTTGLPKAAVATHEQFCWWAETFQRIAHDNPFAGKSVVAYLPMRIMAARLAQLVLHTVHGTETTICPDPSELMATMLEVQPQLVIGVPLVWEKMHATVQAALEADPQRAQQFEQARAVGRQVEALRSAGQPLPAPLQAAWEQVDAVFAPIRQSLGLGRCEMALSGTAPLPTSVVEFFLEIGIPISESYGLSEVMAITFEPYRRRAGSVGRPIPGCEFRFSDEGEILLRSRTACKGYHDDPDKTAASFDDEGWFHTGDLGRIDDDGYVWITGRKKEMLILSDGSSVPPLNLEGLLKGASPLVANACVVGNNRPHAVALLTLNPNIASRWGQERGIALEDAADLAAHPVLQAEIERCVERANADLAVQEKVRGFAVVPDAWAPGSDVVNTSGKLVRAAIESRYAGEIDGLYQRRA